MFAFKKTRNWKKDTDIANFLIVFFAILFIYLLTLTRWFPNSLLIGWSSLVCLVIVFLLLPIPSITHSQYLKSESYIMSTFLKKHKLNINLWNLELNSYQENLNFKHCLIESIQKLENRRKDTNYITFVSTIYASFMIIASFVIFGYYLAKDIPNGVSQFVGIVAFLTLIAQYFFSRPSPAEEIYKKRLTKVDNVLKAQELNS